MTKEVTLKGLEELWEHLLSRKAERVKQAFSALTKDEQESVLAHLKCMSEEPGWHANQRISAQFALDAVKSV
jgi:hypothetical protein